jgi:hypothetical protein
MKNTVKRLWIIALVSLVGGFIISCEFDKSDPYKLDSVRIKGRINTDTEVPSGSKPQSIVASYEISGKGVSASGSKALDFSNTYLTFVWKKDGAVVDGQNRYELTNPVAGSYTVIVTLDPEVNGDTSGCYIKGSKTSSVYVVTD